MKTIDLKNQQDWFLIDDNENEKTQYVFTDEIYSKLEAIIVEADFALDYPLLLGPHLYAPNLKLLGFRGKGCKMCIQSLNRNGFSAPNIVAIGFEDTGITQIPEFILKFKSIRDIHFRHEKVQELPPALFGLINLQTVRFQYGSQISVIPDEIKNLVNLEYFDFWGATIQYLSPELFRLPQIKYINFTDSSYNPSKEVKEAVEEFKMKNSNDFHGWQDYKTR
jgi:Leucine-rich repeat (LRR) protein